MAGQVKRGSVITVLNFYVYFFIKGDVSLLGFKRHKAHESAPPPLTDQEKELELVKQQEVRIITVLFSQFYFQDTRSFAYKRQMDEIDL